MSVTLRELTPDDESAFFEGMKEWVGESPHWYSFAWTEGMIYAEMLEILCKENLGLELKPGRVPHTMLYGFKDGAIVGRVSVRHELNEDLRRRGGHIGYAVAPRFRGQGLATEMVRQALDFCRSMGLQKIMITCADTNEPSWRLIENLGATLEDRTWDAQDQETIRHYWLDL